MKKVLCLIMVLALCLSVCACGGQGGQEKTEEAFTNSKTAFENVTKAYLATNEFSEDIYEAWFQGVNNRDKYDSDMELEAFANEMHIELEYIRQAVANLSYKSYYEYGDWEMLPYYYNGSYFSAWISVISEAYKCSGKADEISQSLTIAKDLMKQLSDDFSDYEHYPILKEYFTNTLAFFDFCCNPEGSFEQVKDTFNNYRNNAREYFFDLNYVFCDSIGGMNDFVAGEETEEETEEDAEVVEEATP